MEIQYTNELVRNDSRIYLKTRKFYLKY